MQKIILYFLVIIAFPIFVSSCSSQLSPEQLSSNQPSSNHSVYKPAKNSGVGYKETLLAPNNYRVEFTFSGSAKRAQDYALLRAAELTNEQGYDWFVVTKRNLDSDADKKSFGSDLRSHQPVIEHNCGLLACTNTVSDRRDVDSGIDENPFPEVKAMLEINFGKGVRPATGNTYDAIETLEKLREKS